MNRIGMIDKLWTKWSFALVVLVIVSLSSDLRFGLTLRLGVKPDFQLFELVSFALGVLFVVALPELLLRWRFAPAGEDIVLVLFIVHAILTSFLAVDPLHSISRAKDFLVCGFLYAFLRYGPFSRRQLNGLLYLLTGIACLWSLVGIWQWMGLDKDFGGDLYRLFLARQALYKSEVNVITGDVVKSTFAHGLYLYPQNFIYYLIVPFAVSVGVSLRKPVYWIVSAVIFIAMMGTLSKTFDILLVIFCSYWLMRKFTGDQTVTLVLLAACGAMVVLPVVFFGDERFWIKALGTFSWRKEIWADTFRMLWEQPSILLTGHGTELLRDVYSREHYPNPHNMFLYFLIEYGIAGFGLFFSFLFLVIRRCSVVVRAGADTCGWHWIALYYGMVLFLSMGIVDDIFVQTQMDGLVLLFLGFLARTADEVATGTARDEMVPQSGPGHVVQEMECHG